MEKIYTIPVNEAFEISDGCPFCRMYEKLESSEIELILGASLMEPDIRTKTNKLGFCRKHYDQMLSGKNRLGLALMLDSHLDCVREAVLFKSFLGLIRENTEKIADNAKAIADSCYICGKIDMHLTKMFETSMLLWDADPDFRKKFDAQPFFCIPHYSQMMRISKAYISKKKLPDFAAAAQHIQSVYIGELEKDIDWFCKKFDYRFKDEPWNNSRDAVERAASFLSGKAGALK
ncbi:MAG: DUF6062 family protein [Oscillospiraceae bacterium]|nr:DUF6062 family protein [Oscillospiraceae bacterium]